MAGDQVSTKRDHIAERVIFWSGLGILATSVMVLGVAAYLKSTNLEQIANTVFNTLIPLFGTWVGLVIAFYFSNKNFNDAAEKTRDLVDQLSDVSLPPRPRWKAFLTVRMYS
jgi:hypothetical protein